MWQSPDGVSRGFVVMEYAFLYISVEDRVTYLVIRNF